MKEAEWLAIAQEDGLYVVADSGGKPDDVRIANFVPQVLYEDVEIVNGKAGKAEYTIVIRTDSGENLPELVVPASELKKMDWGHDSYGSHAMLLYDSRAAKQCVFSYMMGQVGSQNRRMVYRNPGFTKVNDRTAFVHESGVITTGKLTSAVKGSFRGKLSGIDLGVRNDDSALEDALSLLSFLKVGGRDNAVMGHALLCTVLRSALTHIEKLPLASTYLVGKTGSFKSALTMVMQACYGPQRHKLDVLNSWTSTKAVLIDELASMNGGLAVIDDYVHKGAAKDLLEFGEKAEAVFRGVSNKAFRESKQSKAASLHPVVVTSGEHVPHDALESMMNRIIFVEIRDVDSQALRRLQDFAENAVLAKAMHGFIRYCIKNEHSIIKRWSDKQGTYRSMVSKHSAKAIHKRQYDQFASLIFSANTYCNYLKSCGAEDELVRQIRKEARSSLCELAYLQSKIINGSTFKSAVLRKLKLRIKKRRIFVASDKAEYVEAMKGPQNGKSIPPCVGYRCASQGVVCLDARVMPERIFGRAWLEKVNAPEDPRQFYKMLDSHGLVSCSEAAKGESRRTSRVPIGGHKQPFYKVKVAV